MRSLIAAVLLLFAVSAAPAGERDARACPQHGPGFVEVPGTTTCVRIAGRVRAEYGASARQHRSDRTGFGTTARLSVDTRTQTSYGPLRTFVRLRAGSGGPAER